ncbi:conserved hypothetical protein [Leishmania major strain Friedlin]|uniref:non-specific serine/threonine protein kinase n=1 Tax=Leishmania major TaxID=5664 RepID=Q4QIB7_LEIMA|nr:conserved hypothetical protein [Leishmania major strain Friedlin]CAG9569350.1 hypothetical_protein_-_conserved [Leishmania major strain Friedlin]CAJ02231.1 conserved hypothetical protein [Leishmania major strain Friedlin]|eukprot:XP_001681081.1 conserved hypothetical protein [Leishmania major strain Friedlin]
MGTSRVHSTRGTAGARWSAISPGPRSIASSTRGPHGLQRRHGFRVLRFMLTCVIALHAVTAPLSACNAHILHATAPPSIKAETPASPSFFRPNDLPPAVPAAPWRTLNESLLPYPVFYPAIALLNNSILLLGGCATANCATPVGASGTRVAASRRQASAATSVNSPYHERLLSLNVEKGNITTPPQLTLPAGLGFAGRYAAVTLTDSVYVARSCTMSTRSPAEVASMTAEELQAMQAAYAPVVAFYPEGTAHASTRTGGPDPPPAVNLTYFNVPADRVRVNASCTALATENKLLIVGGFLLSRKRVTASVDSFNVVTRKYDADVAFLTTPVLQPSVATSTGFAAVAGGWTYEADTTTSATREARALQEKCRVSRSSSVAASGEPLHLAQELATPPGKLSASPRSDTPSSPPSRPVPSPAPLQPVARYLFDLLFFEPDRVRGGARAAPRGALQTRGSICVSPVDSSTLPRTAVEDILLSPNGCHVAVFGGQVVLVDHNLGHIATLDIRARLAQAFAARAPLVLPPPPVVTLLRTAKPNTAARAFAGAESAASWNAQASSYQNDHAASTAVSASRGSSSAAPMTSSTSSSSSATASSSSSSASLPEYRYSWMQPTLIPLPYARRPSPAAAPGPPVMADTILLYYALGGENVWSEVVTAAGDNAADEDLLDPSGRQHVVPQRHGDPSTLRATGKGREVVVRREPTLRWAQRELPDVRYDRDRPELLAVTMPTPLWPDALTLQTNSEGIIHLAFPDLNYTRYCRWNRLAYNDDDNVVCAVRLSSRRDCVGNTAGTLDSAYDGSPNATILFSASGSTTPVYVCFSYVVRPTLWPTCRIRQSFSILNPMMPLRILDNSHTTSAPTPTPRPSPTRDPADNTTSSPLFMLAVGLSVVTLLVAVLLAARLQHVPEDGLLVMSLLGRGDGAGDQHASPRIRGRGCSGAARHNGQGRRKRPLCGSDEPNKAADAEDDDEAGLCPISTYAEFLQVVGSAEEDSEARMLASAADVLRLHQHRYRVLSRIGQGPHSLCFLALRKAPPPPPPLRVQPQRVRGAGAGINRRVRMSDGAARPVARSSLFTRPPPSFPAVSTTLSPGVPTPATTLPSVAATSSLWAARHDQRTAVVVKYTQCPDDATRAAITRLCERLRDLRADAVTEALGAAGVYRQHRNSAPSRHPRRLYRPSDTSATVSATAALRPLDVPTQLACDIAHNVASGGRSSRGGAAAQARKTDAEDATAPPASRRGCSAVIVTTGSRAGCQPLPLLFSPASKARIIDGDDDDDDNSCAWLDAHEVNVVLSLFLLLPEDLFVSYEVSVLQQQNSNSSSQHAHVNRSGRLTPLSVSRAAVEWNCRHVWPGTNVEPAKASHHRQRHRCTPMLSAGQSFPEQLTPRVCWAACVNPLQPSTVRPWSLCLVMPYERSGDLAGFILRSQQAQLLPADVTGAKDMKRTGLRSRTSASPACVPPVYYCWTESLLCSILFQVCTGLQLLHAQSPPILHGNIKQTNVLLREPVSFSVARRRVVVAGTPAALTGMKTGVSSDRGGLEDANGDLDMATATVRVPGAQQAREEDSSWQDHRLEAGMAAAARPLSAHASFWRASSLVAAATAVWQAGSPVLRSPLSIGSPPSLFRAGATVSPPTAAFSHDAPQEGQRQLQPYEDEQLSTQEPARHLLSAHTYLPISVTDGGMSWWLTVQLPLRLRGCFGLTTRSTLRQTPAGLCWLRRLDSPPSSPPPPTTTKRSVLPSDGCLAALADFLFTFIDVPTHVAPELLWGRLCTLSQSDHGYDGSGAAAGLAVLGSSLTQSSSSLHSTRNRREQYVASSRRDGHQRGDGDSLTHRRCGDVAREPAASPALGSANPLRATTSDELGANATGDKQALGVLPQQQQQPQLPRHDDPCADEDMDDRDAELDIDEDGIFTCEEVNALTSAMWKAEGLTRVPRSRRHHRQAPPQQRTSAAAVDSLQPGPLAASTTTPGGGSVTDVTLQPLLNTTGEDGGHRSLGGDIRGLPSSFSNAPLFASATTTAAGLSSTSSPQPTSQALHHHHNDVDRQLGGNSNTSGRRMAGGGGSVGGEGSRSSSSVYEVLIQRVLAMDTASDIWSLGVLLYGMCADTADAQQQEEQQQHQASASTTTPTLNPPHATAAGSSPVRAHEGVAGTLPPAMPTCTCASRLAQRAFAALLGDLYDLAVTGVPSGDRGNNGWSCDGVDVEQLDEAADDHLRWPRSCALEEEVMQAIGEAGYTHVFASVLASMLSPVAARRPSAGDIVNQLRLVTTGAPATLASNIMRGGGGGLADADDEYSVARQSPPPRIQHSGGASDATSSVMLHEQTACMALRQR